MKFFCLTFILLFTKIFVINSQELLNINESRRPFLVDDINNKRINDIRQNILFSKAFAELNEDQKSQINKIEEEFQKKLNPLTIQLLSLQEKLEILENQDVVNMKLINRNINAQAKLIAKQMKLHAEYKQKIRAVFR